MQGRRGAHAHPEHVAHVLDPGRFDVQRLVERPRGLPSRKKGIRCAWRGLWGREAGGGRREECMDPTEARLRRLWGPRPAQSVPRTCGSCL